MRAGARRPIAAVPARIWERAVPSEAISASCRGGVKEEMKEPKNIQQTGLGVLGENPVCNRISEARAESSASFDCLLHLG